MSKKQPLKSAVAVAIEFRAAFDAAASAYKALTAIKWPEPVCLTVPEIGPGCRVRSADELRDAVATHITITDMPAFQQHEFRQRMGSYSQALEMVGQRYAEWRHLAGIDDIEAHEAEASERKDRAWKSFIAWAKSHPRDLPTLAHALHDRESIEPWRFQEFLKVVGKGVRL